MLLRYLSETAQLVRVKLWNVFLGDFQTDTVNAVLQNRKQNGQHTNKGWGQNKPISSCRVRPINLRLCDPLRGDSWSLKHINVAKKRKAKIKKQRDKGNLFFRNFLRKFHFYFQGQAMNIGEWTLPSQSCPTSQQGPKSFRLTVPLPACCTGCSWQKRQGCSRQGRDPKNISGEGPWHQKAKALQSLTALLFILHLSNSTHLASASLDHHPRITAQVPKERFWPSASLEFQVLIHSHSLASKWCTNWQNRVISAWHWAWQPDNTSKARSTCIPSHVHRHAKFQNRNLFLLQFYDISTAWLSHFTVICIIMGLWQMKQIAIKCWENPKSWLCLVCLNDKTGLNSDGLVHFATNSPAGLNGCYWLAHRAAWWLLNEAN